MKARTLVTPSTNAAASCVEAEALLARSDDVVLEDGVSYVAVLTACAAPIVERQRYGSEYTPLSPDYTPRSGDYTRQRRVTALPFAANLLLRPDE